MIERQEEKDKTIQAKSAEDYLKDGDKYRQQRKWWQAVKAYTKAIELKPNRYLLYDLRGRTLGAQCYFRRGMETTVATTFANTQKEKEMKT